MSDTRNIDDHAASLAESWINGNRSDVAGELEAAGVDGAALACAVAAALADPYWEQRVNELAAYMRRRAEQRASDAGDDAND